MKWKNHALTAGSMAVILNLYPLEVLYCLAGANLPDQMEKIGKTRIFKHRTLTHELLLWLLPVLVLFYAPHLLPGRPGPFSLTFLDPAFGSLALFRPGVFFLPGVLHLCGDVLTPAGILFAGHRIAFPLFRTGQWKEYLATWLLVCVAVLHATGRLRNFF